MIQWGLFENALLLLENFHENKFSTNKSAFSKSPHWIILVYNFLHSQNMFKPVWRVHAEYISLY